MPCSDRCCSCWPASRSSRARTKLANAAEANPDVAPLFVLHEYEGADHGFNMNTSHQRALVADSRDRAIAQLRQYLVDR